MLVVVAASLVVLGFAGRLGAQPQHGASVYRIGFVSHPLPVSPESSLLRAFRQGLRELGYVEGTNLVVDARSSEGREERLPEVVAELIRRKVDVLVVGGTAPTLAAKTATTQIPIVFTSVVDPLTPGIVASLARPGGNVTGITFWVGGAGFAGKWVELLKEAVPHVSHVAVLTNAANPQTPAQAQDIQKAARAMKVTVDVHDAGSATNLDKALAAVGTSGAQGMIVAGDPFFTGHAVKLAQFAASKRLPAVYFFKRFADAGGLMTYGASLEDSHRRAATYVDKILKGVKPANLPVEQPTRFELVLNLKTARALGLKLPQSLLLRADHVIE